METNNNDFITADRKSAKTIAIINGSTVLLIGILCLLGDGASFFAFFIGLLAALVNFILMIINISAGKTYTFVTCIICMLLLPIIGFGCCAMGISNTNFVH